MYPHQIERLTGVLEREGLAALVASSPENVAYLTGFHSMTEAVFQTRQLAVCASRGTALVVPAIDVATIVSDGIEVDHVACFGGFVSDFAEQAGADVRRIRAIMEARATTPADALRAALAALEVREGTLGLDETRLTHDAWSRIVQLLAPSPVVPAASLLGGARRVKAPWEIECLEQALAISEEALNAVLQALKPGVTERDAVTLYQTEVLKRGGAPSPAIIAFGPRSSVPAPLPSDRALRGGDLVRFDLGCVFKGYHASVARTAVLGQPDTRQAIAYTAIAAGLGAAVDRITPGVTAGEVFAAAVEATRAAGLPEYHRYHVGHGIGLEPYERPKLASGSPTPLEAGEVLRVEVPYYEHGWSGLNVRDTVLVTPGGAHGLNHSNRGLIVLD